MRMVFLDAGLLRDRLDLERPEGVPDGQGGSTRSFAPVTGLWGCVEPVTARSDEVAGAIETTVTHRITLRYRDDIHAGMRLRRRDRAFEIESWLDPDETRRFLRCFCREVAP
jgi:SPP1 family predicted phage head-tail adaptor